MKSFDYSGQEQRDGADDTPASEAGESREGKPITASTGRETGRIYDQYKVIDGTSIEQLLGSRSGY